MRYASIDIGTNTIRLLVVEKRDSCRFDFLYQKSRIARLGESFLPEKTLKPQAIQRALNILKGYKNIIDEFDCKDIFAVATSAVREAKNRDEFIDETKRQIGLNIRVIDEKEEAELTHLGIVFFLKDVVKGKKWVAFDIGGGSTEFMFSFSDELKSSFSVPLGVVKLLEGFVKNDPPTMDELREAIDYFIAEFEKFNPDKDVELVVANAGTVTTLAAIDMRLKEYSYKKTEGYRLNKSKIYDILTYMMKINSEERLKHFSILEKGREDVIVVGAYLVYRLLDFFSKEYLITTNGSLREGVVLKELCSG
ncbi:hypothetical protein [Hippea alviniae]|uniref:Ppx/GppA phosphatase family protein n=1 Tax=Hippea alviniae TaxID=1279027 RepID=UPI0003B7A44D|nr:hypothetical protein [Hippea alviniae]